MLVHLEALGRLPMLESNYVQDPPRMTTLEARKLLGRKYSHLADDQIQELINTLTLIARKSLKL